MIQFITLMLLSDSFFLFTLFCVCVHARSGSSD